MLYLIIKIQKIVSFIKIIAAIENINKNIFKYKNKAY